MSDRRPLTKDEISQIDKSVFTLKVTIELGAPLTGGKLSLTRDELIQAIKLELQRHPNSDYSYILNKLLFNAEHLYKNEGPYPVKIEDWYGVCGGCHFPGNRNGQPYIVQYESGCLPC